MGLQVEEEGRVGRLFCSDDLRLNLLSSASAIVTDAIEITHKMVMCEWI